MTRAAVPVWASSGVSAGAGAAAGAAGSGAATAGLRSGDVITKVEGQEVTSPKQLIGYVRRYKAGDTVTMTVARDGATFDVSVTIQGS